MANRQRRTLKSFEANYLKSEIESGSIVKSKRALQLLCKMFRNGVVLQQEDRLRIEIAILGVLSSAASDEKIRRWALSALAYVGRKEVSRNAVLRAVSEYPDEPQVLAAAIATLFKFDGISAQKLISDIGVCSPEIVTLSALQTTNPNNIDVSNLNIDIDSADSITLKLALVLVGLNRSPENIFHPRHSNSEIVRVLGVHHEAIVSQYSVWAAAENPNLSAANIGIDLRDLDLQQPNVRSYVYRLFAEEDTPSSQRHEIIVQGSKDDDTEARLGLAIGLRDSFYDGLQDVTIDWFHDEDDMDVSAHVLDHIVAHADRVSTYRNIALEHYEFAEDDPKKRFRMEASAAGTRIYTEFKRKSIQQEASLFGLTGVNVTNNNSFTNNGNIQGAFSQSGQAVNHGQMQAAFTQGQAEDVAKLLDSVINEIETMPLAGEIKGELRKEIETTKGKMDKESLSRVVSVLERSEKGLKAVSGMADYAIKIGTLIMGLSAFL